MPYWLIPYLKKVVPSSQTHPKSSMKLKSKLFLDHEVRQKGNAPLLSPSFLPANLPNPMPDELAVGLAGRLARLNGISSTKQLISLLRQEHSNNKQTPAIWILASALSMDVHAFAAAHTLLPVRYPISAYVGLPNEANAFKQRAFLMGMATVGSNIFFCTDCAKEQTLLSGFSYWKRQHQLEGLEWCLVHRLPLIKRLSSDAYVQPHTTTEVHTVNLISQVELAPELESEVLNQLFRIQLEWLSSSEPIALEAWSEVISRRCESLGLRRGEVGHRTTASDVIRDRFPMSWLQRYIPEIVNKAPGQFLRKIDGACIDKHVTYPSLACAALLAALFDSAEQALKQLREAHQNFLSDRNNSSAVVASDERLAFQYFLEGNGLVEACEMHCDRVRFIETYLRTLCGEREAALKKYDLFIATRAKGEGPSTAGH